MIINYPDGRVVQDGTDRACFVQFQNSGNHRTAQVSKAVGWVEQSKRK